jgi:hypothetical protein
MNPKYIVLVTDITIFISKTPVYGLILDLCWKTELWKGNDASGSTKSREFLDQSEELSASQDRLLHGIC